MIARLWQRDTTLFAPADAPAAVHAAIANRLGWLDAPASMLPELPGVRAVLDAARADGLTHLVLLGMGGSSLCADVLRQSAAFTEMATRLTMIDSTDERTVLEAAAAHDPARTLFLVASKSGGTIEVTALERYFRQWVERAVGPSAGSHFIGITDPGTPLVTRAAEAGYRHLWLNPPDIGGRYSALSLFGLVPAMWLGLDVHALLGSAAAMAAECRLPEADNPGFALGAFMADQARAGRDKLTLLPVAPLGMWIEQLVAESTGKNGVGVLPIVDEPEGAIAEYGRDRAFVAMLANPKGATATRADALEAAGHPVFRIDLSRSNLGREFFRWEFATAVAGARLGVNPFDEPNVSDAKARTKTMLDHYLAHHAWPEVSGVERARGVDVRRVPTTQPRPDGPGYIALLDYLPTDRDRAAAMERIRRRLRASTGAATTYGIGPRYLHSTGQFHKGGPNSGRFVLMTSVDATATEVPGLGYTFSVLKHAQALGDVAALTAAGRDVLHIHNTDAAAEPSAVIERVLSE
jgi:transaldolase/glucose-6-phosphate isomerase